MDHGALYVHRHTPRFSQDLTTHGNNAELASSGPDTSVDKSIAEFLSSTRFTYPHYGSSLANSTPPGGNDEDKSEYNDTNDSGASNRLLVGSNSSTSPTSSPITVNQPCNFDQDGIVGKYDELCVSSMLDNYLCEASAELGKVINMRRDISSLAAREALDVVIISIGKAISAARASRIATLELEKATINLVQMTTTATSVTSNTVRDALNSL